QLDHMLCLDGFLVIEVMVFAVLTGCEEKLHGKKDGCMGKLAARAACQLEPLQYTGAEVKGLIACVKILIQAGSA
ncbi:MAG: hypothetical protein OEY01_16805, partial [Desulfobulbaceae bacterium]|nr:hypothetical protein [Desulfobulbaceae bacterium]